MKRLVKQEVAGRGLLDATFRARLFETAAEAMIGGPDYNSKPWCKLRIVETRSATDFTAQVVQVSKTRSEPTKSDDVPAFRFINIEGGTVCEIKGRFWTDDNRMLVTLVIVGLA